MNTPPRTVKKIAIDLDAYSDQDVNLVGVVRER